MAANVNFRVLSGIELVHSSLAYTKTERGLTLCKVGHA